MFDEFPSLDIGKGTTYYTSLTPPKSTVLWPLFSTSGFFSRLKNLEVIRRASAIFRCVLNGDTAAIGQWFRNNVPLTHSDKTRIAVDGRERELTITDVQFEDTGNYEYRVNQDLTSANLTLNEATCVNSMLNPPQPAMRPV
ncbi:obscurin-like [Haliotis cracherodii]|uniref:obscurin-like n=1 Tax=Haliotis cracherodii TaxID=6455 RepID=UPI0039EA5DE7